MKKIKKLLSFALALILVSSMLVPLLSVFAATGVSYEKTGIVYTISGVPYYQAKTTKDFNGVAKGTLFWLDKNNSIVVNADTINKLERLTLSNQSNIYNIHIGTVRSCINSSYSMYDAYMEIVNMEGECDISGYIIGQSFNLALKTSAGPVGWGSFALDVVADGLEMAVSDATNIAIIQMFKIYINNLRAYGAEALKYENKTMTEYNDMIGFAESYANCVAGHEAAWFVAGEKIQDYNNYLKVFGNNFWNIMKSCASTIFPDEGLTLLLAAANGTLDGLMSFEDVAASSESEKIYYKHYLTNFETAALVDFDTSLKIETAKKLAKTNSAQSPSIKLSAPNITNKSTFATNENVKLTWSALSGADYYGITVVNNQNNKVVFDDDIVNNYLDLGKLASGKYRWQVRGHNSAGWGDLTNLSYFTVENSNNTSGNMTVEVFNTKLNKFKEKYPHGSKYIDNPSKTGGYQCFGFANELGVDIFGSYPTNSMSATSVNNTWTVTYGGEAVDSLCVGDIVRYYNHSIFITEIVNDTIYYCEALGDVNNKVQWGQSISRATLKKYVSEKLTSNNTNKTGWVAHCKNGLAYKAMQDTNTQTPNYETIPEGTYIINSTVNDYRYLTAKTDSNGGQVQGKPHENINAQKFKIVECKNGYQIVCKGSSAGRVINVYRDGTSKNGDNITLWESTKDGTQIWNFEKSGNAYIIRPSDNSSLALTAGSTGGITVSTYTGASNQLWLLTRDDLPKTYTVTYNANGGTGAPSAQTKTHGTALYIANTKPTRDGYEFFGWSETANGSVKYDSGVAYTTDSNVTLYAVWKANEYTVTYNANGGTGAPSAQTKTYGESIVLNAIEPTREDYIFLGWGTSVNGSVEYASGSTFDLNQNVTLYALWQKEENEVYYVIYNANGGKNAPPMQTKIEDEDVRISDVVPIREGYIFDGWAVGSSNVVAYSSNDIYSKNQTVYLNAVWTAKKYTLSYNGNGGVGAPVNQQKTHDVNIIISYSEPQKENYKFVGWSENPNAVSAEYFSGDLFVKNIDTVLYAVWEKDNEKIENMPFNDIPEDAWYRKDVENAYNNGLINGKGENRYAPNDNMTYAEAIKLACTIHQLYHDGEVTITNGADIWYSTYMEYAIEKGIVRTDYSTVANKYVTRKDFVNIFYGALPLNEYAEINHIADNQIPDVKIGDAYSGEIYTFYRAGILTGNDTKGTFKPSSNIARSEVAAIVTRMLDSGARKEMLIQ